MKIIWEARIPLKIKNFLWQLHHDKLPTAEQLIKREWEGETNYPLCHRNCLCLAWAVCWNLWRDRNKMRIEKKKMVTSPSEIMFKTIASMQQWKIMLPNGGTSKDIAGMHDAKEGP
jgi:hypothetical protein